MPVIVIVITIVIIVVTINAIIVFIIVVIIIVIAIVIIIVIITFPPKPKSVRSCITGVGGRGVLGVQKTERKCGEKEKCETVDPANCASVGGKVAKGSVQR